MIRDKNYLKSSKMDSRVTGGLFFNLFVHYIDLAIQHRCTFDGWIGTEGTQSRYVESFQTRFNLDSIPIIDLYTRMYKKIVNENKGIKPKDIMFLRWWLERHSEIFGYGINAINNGIIIEPNF
jgi:hypothetical protein